MIATMTMNVAGIVEKVAEARARFRGWRTRPGSWHRVQLEALKSLLKKEESRIFEALWADRRKPRLEPYRTEVGFVISEIDDALGHLERWMRPERKHTWLLAQPGRSWTIHDPLAVVLIIGAWNYPINLLLAPLAPGRRQCDGPEAVGNRGPHVCPDG